MLGHVERHLHVRHGAKVVYLGRLDRGNELDQVGGVTEVPVVKEKLDASIVVVLVNVIYTASVERRGTADDSMNLGLIQNTVWVSSGM